MPNRDVLESNPLANKLSIRMYDDGHIHYVSLDVLKPLNTYS